LKSNNYSSFGSKKELLGQGFDELEFPKLVLGFDETDFDWSSVLKRDSTSKSIRILHRLYSI